jgi:predicted site-specific integrase-resolvase
MTDLHPGVTGRKSSQSDRVLTEPQFAERLGVSVITVRRQRKAGLLDHIELSEHRIGYRESYVDQLLDERTVKATNPIT